MNNKSYKSVFELRADGEGKISGYASTFNGVDSVGDTILPGAYDKVIASGEMPAMFYNHDHWELPIGKWTSLKADDHGLFVEGLLDLNQKDAAEIFQGIQFGSITGLSVCIFTSATGTEMTGPLSRSIHEVERLPEISVVSMPADPDARIVAVKDIEQIASIRDFERCLRDAGLSKSCAVALCAKARAIFSPRSESEPDEKAIQWQQIAARLNQLTQLLGGKHD